MHKWQKKNITAPQLQDSIITTCSIKLIFVKHHIHLLFILILSKKTLRPSWNYQNLTEDDPLKRFRAHFASFEGLMFSIQNLGRSTSINS
jgi:hypothetical protein